MTINLVALKNTYLLSCSSEDENSGWTRLGSLLEVSQVQNQGIGWAGLLSGSSGEESASKLVQIVGRILFFAIGGSRSSFPCWLPAADCSQFLKTPCVPWHVAPFISATNNGTWKPLCASNLWLPLLPLFPLLCWNKTLLSKGSRD